MAELDIQEIMNILPHRYPILLVDKIVECDGKEKIVGIKNVSANEPYFQGHFPGMPIMPGVLQLEAMAQTAGVLLTQLSGDEGGVPFFMSMDKVKFRKIVRPGDQLRMEIQLTKVRAKTARFSAKGLVDGVVVSEADMMCMLADEKVVG
ncbi:3-hydroxyacyl-[acyl-carrier-protein] dehydratase FabZ [bacterium E08(2017)]|nr:3-hydroxyacyl-[acyl-carrier-protein] dehydratase FabZ [bacterium E08(2017)]